MQHREPFRHGGEGVAPANVASPAPALRPFKVEGANVSFAQIAASKGIAVDPAAAAAVDALQEAANGVFEAMRGARRAGTVDAETAWERSHVARRECLLQARRLVGAEAMAAALGDLGSPGDPAPDLPDWPYWLRKTIARGRGREEGRLEHLELMGAILHFCREGTLEPLDAAYRRIDVTGLSELSLFTLLRVPSTQKDRLEAWGDFRDRVREEVMARGRDDLPSWGLEDLKDRDVPAGGPAGPR